MTAAENDARNSYVLMQVGRRRFALPADIVAELAPPVRLHAFPHMAPLVAGVIVRRGQIIPVYDVAPLLLGRKSTVHRFYLIARREFGDTSESSAIPVDGECELATAEREPPESGQPEYVCGKLAIGEESIDILDFEALVTSRATETDEANSAEAQS